MGALVTRALRPIKSFNIENRAHRVISKEKPVPAPKYPANIEDMRRAIEADPELDEKLHRKDPGLDSRLRDVYVTSVGKPEDDITREIQKEKTTDRPLPENRTQVEEFEYGFKEPGRVTYGRTTLRHAINFISAYQMNPEEATPAKIAAEYKLKEEDVLNVLKYFKTYEVYLPETRTTPATFAGPANMRKQLLMQDEMLKLGKTEESKIKYRVKKDLNRAKDPQIDKVKVENES